MKCPHCGKETEDQAIFCENCGKPLSDKVRTPKKIINKKHFRQWTILLSILCLSLAAGSVFYTINIKPLNSPYKYSMVEDRIAYIVGQITGNKNNVKVPTDKKNLKIYAENIAENLIKRMSKAKEMEMPEDICNIADQYTEIKSRQISQIDCFEQLNENLQAKADAANVDQETLLHTIIPTVVGNVADIDEFSFTNSFYMEMTDDSAEQVQGSIWMLNYTDQFSVGVAFIPGSSGIIVQAWPIAADNMQKLYNKVNQFFGEHVEYN